MNTITKEKLIESAKAFYFNEGTRHYTDEEYDKGVELYYGGDENLLRTEIDLGDYEYSPKERKANSLVSKVRINSDKFEDSLKRLQSEGGIITPKYDGCFIASEYNKKGELVLITTKSGRVQNGKLAKYVPNRIDPSLGISHILCEGVVDLKHGLGGLSRQKANGLVNSKHRSDEVKDLLSLVVFGFEFHDGVKNPDRILTTFDRFFENNNYPKLVKANIGYGDNPIRSTNELSEDYLIDGFVSVSENGDINAVKFYFKTSQKTKVIGIEYKETPKLGYSAVLNIDPVELDGTTIRSVSTNGVGTLMDQKCGIGAVVEVVLSGSTIPKINKVLKESEVYTDGAFSCGCGTEIEIKDDNVYGNTLKCPNPSCIVRGEKIDLEEYTPEHSLAELLVVDRYKSKENEQDKVSIFNFLKDKKYKSILNIYEKYMSSMQLEILSLHLHSI